MPAVRIGIVTDVHDDVEKLTRALAALRAERVGAIVSLGDATDLFGKWDRADEIAAALREAGVVGVWGNHDIGLCRDVRPELRGRFSPATLDYMSTVRPRLELEDCHFSHVDPWLDPEVPENLWSFDGAPDDADRLAKSFAAVPHRRLFLGHFHRWVAATERGRLDWEGAAPLAFEADRRYLVVVAPLFAGAFAVLDTDRGLLEPRRL